MLIPSYAELMDVLNKESNENDEITSRYTIVIATAKRARQLIEGDAPMVNSKKGKPVSTAVDEISCLLKISPASFIQQYFIAVPPISNTRYIAQSSY